MHRRSAVHRTTAIATCASAFLAFAAPVQSRLADRVVVPVGREDAGMFVYPHIWQSHLRFLVVMIARSAQVPIGFEEVAGEPTPFDGDLSKVPIGQRTSLVGLTVGQALDHLVAVDPRYSWREEDGLLQIRPAAAWADADHYLRRPAGPIELARRPAIDFVKRLYERSGLDVISAGGGVIGDPPSSGYDLDRPVSLTLESASILETLNAVVKAHGKLGWLVHYAHGPATIRNSCIRLITFDGHFGEVSATRCGASY